MKPFAKIVAYISVCIGLLYLGLVLYIRLHYNIRLHCNPEHLYFDYRYNTLVIKPLAWLGSADAQYKMGLFYTLPREYLVPQELTEEELEQAIFWFSRATQQGHVKALAEWDRCCRDLARYRQKSPKLNMEVLLNCNNTSYVQRTLASKINAPYDSLFTLLMSATQEFNQNRALSDTTVSTLYATIDRQLNFDSLFVATVGCDPKKNIHTEYAYDIFKLDLTTGIIFRESPGLSRAEQGIAKSGVNGELERRLMLKYYNLLHDQITDKYRRYYEIKNSQWALSDWDKENPPQNVHLLLEKNQKQWEALCKQKYELYWACFENADGTWPVVSHPGWGYYRERISFLFDCYLNYNNTHRSDWNCFEQ